MGLILSKLGMGEYNAFAATHIRIMFGIVGFSIVFTVMRKWGNLYLALKNTDAMKKVSIGAFFGPFLGVSFSLLALQYTTAGVASTITAIGPVLIILPSVLILKERVTLKEIIGAGITVIGVAMLFI